MEYWTKIFGRLSYATIRVNQRNIGYESVDVIKYRYLYILAR